MSDPATSSTGGTGGPSLDSVFQMKQFLTSQRVSFVDCVEKADLVKRVQETLAKQQQQPPQQVKTCDCMQSGPESSSTEAHHHHHHGHSHGHSAAAAAAKEARKAKKANGAIIRQLPVGPLQCNMVIIADPVTKEACLVDPGGDPDKILALIKEMGVIIKQILITHGHFDHFLAAYEINQATKAPVLLHDADAPLFAACNMQCMMFGQQPPKNVMTKPTGFLTDGMELAVRGGRVIHTPGHSLGSCCFYFAADDLLCSGDTLFRQSVGRTDLPGGNSNELVKSIQTRLYTLPGETAVIPGHGPSTDIEFESKYNGVVKAKSSAL